MCCAFAHDVCRLLSYGKSDDNLNRQPTTLRVFKLMAFNNNNNNSDQPANQPTKQAKKTEQF